MRTPVEEGPGRTDGNGNGRFRILASGNNQPIVIFCYALRENGG